MIRTFLAIILLIAFFIYTIIDVVIGFLISIFNKDLSRKISVNAVKVLFNLLIFISGVRIHIKGKENIDEAEPLFIIANHRGIFDVIIGYTFFKRPTGIIAKDSFKNIPILSYWMKKLDVYFLDRKDLRAGAMMVIDSINKLKKGMSIWVFPEGTRNKKDDIYDLLDFKTGAFKIAEKSNAKILPIAFVGTEKIYEKHKPWIKASDVYINIGKIYNISELNENDKIDLGIYNRNLIIDLIKEVYDEKR